MVKQLNIFLENRPGRIETISHILADNKVNVIAFTIQDRGDFGMIKLLVDKPDAGYLVLADKGFACALKEVVVVSIKDKPGNLSRLTALFAQNNINITDAHGFVMKQEREGLCCIEVAAALTQEFIQIIQKEGFKVLHEDDIRDF